MVLDVGAGNGYYCLRMLGAGARLVVGIDPNQRYLAQFLALKRYLGTIPAFLLPLGIDDMPRRLAGFDTVFSMGVLYHRREPLLHLQQLAELLRPGGELVLESLVVDTGVLQPAGRYAKMANVWAVPSTDILGQWLRDAGYRDIRIIDSTPTTTDEQRRTPWMEFESLADFLDPDDPRRTIEGLPAPVRAIALATKP